MVLMKLGMNVTLLQAIPTLYFSIPFHKKHQYCSHAELWSESRITMYDPQILWRNRYWKIEDMF
jgi:hypothetical protein